MEIPKNLITVAADQSTNSIPSTGPDGHYKLLKAQDYARRGLYAQAEQLLSELNESQEHKTAVLDLKGKMLAQRGRYAEAEKCWMEAVSLDSGNQAYRKSLDAIVESRQNLLIRLAKSKVSAVFVIVLLLAVMFNMIVSSDKSNYDSLSLQMDSIQQGLLSVREQESKSIQELEEKYREIYRLREDAFLDSESRYIHQIENLLGRVKKLEKDLEAVNIDSNK